MRNVISLPKKPHNQTKITMNASFLTLSGVVKEGILI